MSSDHTRQLLTNLSQAILEYKTNCVRVAKISENSETVEQRLDAALEDTDNFLRSFPRTKVLDVGNGQSVEGSSWAIDMLKTQLDSIPGLARQAVVLATKEEVATSRAELAERQNLDLRQDVNLLRGYVAGSFNERRMPEPQLPSLNSDRWHSEDDRPCRMGFHELDRR